MASKTLIGGTAYDILGGKTLVSGTSYSVKNGKVLVGGTAYDISFVLPPNVLDMWYGQAYDDIKAIVYTNGYWVVAGHTNPNGSHCYARIAYSTSLDGTWTIKDLWDENSTISAGISDITYANGYWVACGYTHISYATSLDGTWTTITPHAGVSYKSITYTNGYWVGCGSLSSGNPVVIYNTTLSDYNSGWAMNSSIGSNWYDVNCFTYANGYWVVGGTRRITEGTTSTQIVDYFHGSIAYSTSLSGAWTVRDIWEAPSTGDENSIDCVTYANGYWVVGGNYSVGAPLLSIAYAASLDGAFTTKNLWEINATSFRITSISYGNGSWVVGWNYYDGTNFYHELAYATSLGGTWSRKDLWSSPKGTFIALPNTTVEYADGYWVVGARCYDNSKHCVRLAYAPTPAELGNTE